MDKQIKKQLRKIARNLNPLSEFEKYCDKCTNYGSFNWDGPHRAAWRKKWLPRFEFYLHHKSRGPEHVKAVTYRKDGAMVFQWARVVKIRSLKVLIPVSFKMVRQLSIAD